MRLMLDDGACVIPGGACVWVGAGMPSNHRITDWFGLEVTSSLSKSPTMQRGFST